MGGRSINNLLAKALRRSTVDQRDSDKIVRQDAISNKFLNVSPRHALFDPAKLLIVWIPIVAHQNCSLNYYDSFEIDLLPQVSEAKDLERLQKLDQRALVFVAQAWFSALKLMGTKIVASVYNQVGALAEFK